VDLLSRGQYQPRQDMRQDTLEELADSIRAQGVVQPILVRHLSGDSGRYEIIAGERRWRAAQMAGLGEIPAVIRDVPDESAVAISLIENIQRENLNPLEEAGALNRLIQEFEMTHQQAAEAVGRSRAAVSNLLRLLDLSADVKAMLENRKLEMGHARALLALPESRQVEAGRLISKKGLSVREAEKLVKRLLAGKQVTKKPAMDPDILLLQTELSEKLGARVVFRHNQKGSGQLMISYNSVDELEGILEHIR
jgi:ParB family chromosome partitioning protein